MYIQHQASKESGIDKRNILLYALCILYILSAVTVALDVVLFFALNEVSKSCIHYNRFFIYTVQILTAPSPSESSLFRYGAHASITVAGLCDFISQGILVCINLHSYLLFASSYHLNFPRFTDVGSYGVATSVS